MKIGLIGINIYPKYLNFACGLHVWAFQQFLQQQGIEAKIIDYKPVHFDNFNMRHPVDHYKNKYQRLVKKTAQTPEEQEEKELELRELQKKIDDWGALYEEREIRYEKFQSFIDRHYIKTQETYDSDLLEIKDPGFDCYICVTDVIWGLLPVHTFDRAFLLASKAMEGKQKISYAVSRGVPKAYTQEQKALFFRSIEDIDDISVRERSLKEFIEENSNKEAAVVLDPVMLHNKEFWHQLSVKPEETGYILLYYVMEQAADTIARTVEYAKQHDLLIVELSDRPVKGGRVKDDHVRHIARYDVSMEEWLGYLEYADCIFTNSFHGCCYAILFEKLFYVGNRDGDKVTNILETFGLQQLRMTKAKDGQDVLADLPKEIDYEPVREILRNKQEQAKEFVFTALKKAEQRLSENIKKDPARYEEHRRSLTYPLNYHSGKAGASHSYDTERLGAKVSSFASGAIEYSEAERLYKNDGASRLEKNRFFLEGHKFIGWSIRLKIDNHWFWYMSDGSLVPVKGFAEYKKQIGLSKMLLPDEGTLPAIPVNRIRNMVAEANWERNGISLLYKIKHRILRKKNNKEKG